MDDSTVKQRLFEMSDGMLVEEDVLGIVHRLQEYDPNLIVQYADPDKVDITDAPYRVVELCPDGNRRVVLECWALDERVVERIMRADTQKHNILEGVDNKNNLVRKGIRQRYRDEQAALSEMVDGVLRSPKDTYTATNPLTGQKHTFRSVQQSPR
jgi:hypothetical protein